MRRLSLLVVPALVLAVTLGAAAPPPATAPAPAAPQAVVPATGISHAGPVIPLDLKPNTEIFKGGLYLDSTSSATAAVTRALAEGRTADAALLKQISGQPTAVWLGEWYTATLLKNVLTRHVAAARLQGRTPVFVTYAIPNRDCGGYSAGGLTPDAYLQWNREIAALLAGTKAVVIVEPDSLSMLTNGRCPGETERRLDMMRKAVGILAGAGLTLYLDAGHSGWVKPEVMAPLLESAGVYQTRGFVTNVSNYRRVEDERLYADKVSKLLGGKAYVIDVSRNGNGWLGQWCNPPGAALGQNPHVTSGTTKLDALLWVKRPGQSDGTCNGGPRAGEWWESYALDLVRNRR